MNVLALILFAVAALSFLIGVLYVQRRSEAVPVGLFFVAVGIIVEHCVTHVGYVR